MRKAILMLVLILMTGWAEAKPKNHSERGRVTVSHSDIDTGTVLGKQTILGNLRKSVTDLDEGVQKFNQAMPETNEQLKGIVEGELEHIHQSASLLERLASSNESALNLYLAFAVATQAMESAGSLESIAVFHEHLDIATVITTDHQNKIRDTRKLLSERLIEMLKEDEQKPCSEVR